MDKKVVTLYPKLTQKDELLALTRLMTPNEQKLTGSHTLAQMYICADSGGAAAIIADSQFDGHGRLRDLSIQHWWFSPSGYSDRDQVLHADFSYIGNQAIAQSMHVYQRSVEDVGAQRVALQMAGQIIEDMRHHNILPNLARIFHDNDMNTILGENITIPGFDSDKGLNFYIPDDQDALDKDDIVFPRDIINILQSGGVNTIDATLNMPKPLSVGVDPKTKKVYRTDILTRESKTKISLAGTQKPIDECANALSENVMDHLFGLTWQMANKDEKLEAFKLAQMSLFDNGMDSAKKNTKLQTLGLINTVLNRIRTGKNPELPENLIRRNLFEFLFPMKANKTLEEGGEAFIVSLYGNNEKNMFKGLGDGPGECKIIGNIGKDKEGKRKILAASQDLSFIIPAEGSKVDGFLPDALLLMMLSNHHFISHRHIDHLDGNAIAVKLFMESGAWKDHHFYGPAKVMRQLKRRMNQLYAKTPDLLPYFHVLEGEGHVDLQQGDQHLRVEYLVEGVPHSDPVTSYRFIPGSNGVHNASVRIHADARTEEDWHAVTPERDEEYFKRGMRSVGVDRQDTLIFYDVLSNKNAGFAPRIKQCEDNLFATLSSQKWIKDRLLVVGMLSKNEATILMYCRLFNRLQRDFTFYGTNIEDSANDLNVVGVSERNPGHFANAIKIQTYLDEDFVKLIVDYAVQEEQETTDQSIQHKAHIIQKLDDYDDYKNAKDLIRICFDENLFSSPALLQEAADSMDSDSDYGLTGYFTEQIKSSESYDDCDRIKNEVLFLNELMEKHNIERPARYMRRTNLEMIAKIIDGHPGNVAILATLLTKEAAIPKWYDGRGLLAADPQTRPTAIPVFSHNSVTIINQTTNPSNDSDITKTIKNGIDRGFPIIQASNNGYTHHGFPDQNAQTETLSFLNNKGKLFDLSGSKETLAVYNMPIHYQGHGQQKDNEVQMKKDMPDMVAPTHGDSDPDNNDALFENAEKLGVRPIKEKIKMAGAYKVDKGDTPDKATFKYAGSFPLSIYELEFIRKQGQFHGGYIKADRITLPRASDSFSEAIKAGSRHGNVAIRQAVPDFNIEQEKYKHDTRKKEPKMPSKVLIEEPRRFKYRGQKVPCVA